MSFSNQTSKNKVYFEKIIVSTTKVDHSSPTFPFPVQKDPPLVQDAYYKKWNCIPCKDSRLWKSYPLQRHNDAK